MNSNVWLRPRIVVLFFLWTLPIIVYGLLGIYALYQTGWMLTIAWTLPLVWLTAWIVASVWRPPKMEDTVELQPLRAPDFWTPRDTQAINVVETFRKQVEKIDRLSITDINRFVGDAEELARRLSIHYYPSKEKNAFHSITLVEVLAVIHLATEDVENWIVDKLPGSHLVTIGNIQELPKIATAIDVAQNIAFFVKAAFNPITLLTYPTWRSAGSVTVELQNEVAMAFYQQYLQHIGFYLIEMYSGRLKGGTKQYRESFGRLSTALHRAGGDTELFDEIKLTNTTIAIMGQVKAGKSSLINALMNNQIAKTSILPSTRQVQKIDFELPGIDKLVTLLDTPGYNESNVSGRQRDEIRKASEAADILLLVIAANSPARDPDVAMLESLKKHYRENSHLKPPTVIVVLTHIDMLRPIREWNPPYDWHNPSNAKEQSIAQAVDYCKELFGNSVASYACVYTGEQHTGDESITDDLIPRIIEQLPSGQSAAILKAFYRRLSQKRYEQLKDQVTGMMKYLGRKILD